MDQATADPPASTLTASGIFTAGQMYALAWKPKVTIVIDEEGNVEVRLEVVIEPDEAAPASMLIGVRDMSQGSPGVPALAQVKAWHVDHPTNAKTGYTNFEGKVTFTNISPSGSWVVRVSGAQTCEYEFRLEVQPHQVSEFDQFRICQHWPIGGKVWFKNELGQVIAGDPYSVTLVLVENGDPVDNADETVTPTQNPDGSYTYSVQPYAGSLPVGDFDLRAYYPGEDMQTHPVTYLNDCYTQMPWADYSHKSPGAHSQVEGPSFTFTIEQEPPPEP
ncbi:MAG: hypothetical protein AB7Y46_00390 [Armatimonadota bacterium]